jgi:acetyl esterase/lipase
MKNIPVPTLSGDVFALRKVLSDRKKALTAAQSTGTEGLKEMDITVPARDGYPIPVRIYKPTSPPAGGSPLVIFFHGGGFALGGLENEELNCRLFVQKLGCTCVNVDYRLAPEHPFPTPALDSWDVTKWVCLEDFWLLCRGLNS